jgi:DNA-binding LytR/AlgR family response regulator
MEAIVFNFVIIDDDKEISKMVEAVISQTFDDGIEYYVKSFDKYTDYKDDESNKDAKSIFVLDIELNDDYDGIEIASIIRRRKNKNHEIIFLTGYVDYAFSVLNYKINPIAFIKKDENFRELLKKALREAVDKINLSREGRKLIIKKSSGEIELKENDIIYVEKNKGTKSINIVTKLCNVETIETIESFSNRTSEEFIKIDRSTIINHKFIQSVDTKKRIVIMSNDEVFYVDDKIIKRVMELGN